MLQIILVVGLLGQSSMHAPYQDKESQQRKLYRKSGCQKLRLDKIKKAQMIENMKAAVAAVVYYEQRQAESK